MDKSKTEPHRRDSEITEHLLLNWLGMVAHTLEAEAGDLL